MVVPKIIHNRIMIYVHHGRRVETIDSHPVTFALPYICTMAMDDIHHGDRPQSQQQQPNAFTSPQVVDHIV